MSVWNLIGPIIDWRLLKIMKRRIIISCKPSSFQMLPYLNDTKGKDFTLFQVHQE